MPDDAVSQDELDSLIQDVGTGRFARDRRYELQLATFHGCPLLRITGMVLQAVPDEFTKRLHRLVQGGSGPPVVVDLGGCTYLCSGAVGALIFIFSAAPRVLLLKPNERIAAALRITGIDAMVTMVADEAEAEAMIERLRSPG